MKYLFSVLFLFSLVLGQSQTQIPIVGFRGTINTFPTVSGDTLTATITLLDQSNQFTGNSLVGRDSLVLWRNCRRYRVDTVLTAFATSVTVKLLKEGNPNLTTGVCAFIEETKTNRSFAPAGISDGERQCINAYYAGADSLTVKVKNSPTMILRIENDSIRADIRKRLNRDTIGGQGVFLALRVDSTGQLLGYDEILSDDFDDDPYNEFQTLSSNGLPGHISLSDGGQEYINVNDADANPTNEIQTLSKSGNNLTISGGNTVSIADGDSDPNNELQALYIDSTANRIFNIGLSPGGGIVYFKDSTGLTDVQIGNIISDSLALITTEPDSIQRVGNTISLQDGSGSVDVSDLVNVADSTSIVDGWGITSVESPTNTYNLMADSSQVATPYDLTLKQDKLTVGSGIEIVGTNIINNTKPFNNIRLSENNGTQFNLVDGGLLNINTSPPFTLSRTSGNFTFGMTQASSANDGFLSATNWNTFNSKENALTFNSPLSRSGNTISIQTASGSQAGALSAANWTTFNNKIGGTVANNRLVTGLGTGSIQSLSNLEVIEGASDIKFQSYSSKPIIFNALGNEVNFPAVAHSSQNRPVFIEAVTGRLYNIQNISVNSAQTEVKIQSFGGQKLFLNDLGNTVQCGGLFNLAYLTGGSTRMLTVASNGDVGQATIPTGTVTSVNITNGGGLSVAGGPITTSGSITLTAVDGSITNEGRIGVTAGGSNSAGLQGYNEPGTTTGAAATINGSGGILITETTGTPSGGTINVETVSSHIVQISRTTTLTNSTAGTYTFNFTNQDILLPASPAPYTADISNDEIVFTNTGTYEVTFSGVGTISGGNNIYFQRWDGSSWVYINSAGEGYASGTYANITFTALAQFIANDKIRIRYGVSTGQTASFDYSRLIVKRLR